MKNLELLNLVAQIRHVFGGESFIWWAVCKECGGGRQRSDSRLRMDTGESASASAVAIPSAR